MIKMKLMPEVKDSLAFVADMGQENMILRGVHHRKVTLLWL